jgi:hypothetical protein
MGSTEVPPAARQGPEDIREINREQINIRLEHKNSDSPPGGRLTFFCFAKRK